ncbi:MAG: hypothetical protein ACRCX2_11425 [Paraclostridium sp.]
MNFENQKYKELVLTQCNRKYGERKARRFYIFNTTQAIWIPCKFLHEGGTIKENVDIDWIFKSKNNSHILELAKKQNK